MANPSNPVSMFSFSTINSLQGIIIILVLLNVIFGIILDTFGALRSDTQERREMELKQSRLNDILNHARAVLGDRDCTELFMAADHNQDGHCGYEEFAQLLEEMGLGLGEEDVELMMESFFDPEHPDQTRPMSIMVLDEALHR